MKKQFLALFSLLLCAALLFSGCGAGKAEAPMDSWNMTGAAAPSAAPEEYWPEPDMGYDSNGFASESWTDGGISGLLEYPDLAESSDKIIYSAWADLETLEFEQSLEGVYKLIERCGGFVESSDVSGRDYSSQFYGRKNYRSANFTIRVPKEKFSTLMNSLSELGNVTYSSTQAENITSQFTDTESRLNMYKAEEARLLSMLEKAETVEEMILIESRLSEVRYNIESLTTQLNNWQKQVDYSTVTLHINEVEKLTEEVPIQRSYWEQVGDTLTGVLKGIGDFFKDFLRLFIAALPILAICGAITGIVLGIVFGARKARRKRRAAREEDKQG